MYVCELCGARYDTAERAEKCENAHQVPVEIAKLTYGKPSGDFYDFSEYPTEIGVRFNDGYIINYKR